MMSREGSGESSTYLPKLDTGHNRSVCGKNLRVMDDIVSPWMKHYIEV